MNITKSAIILMVLVLMCCSTVQAQSTIVLLAEDFENLPLGPNVDEGLAGDAVWTDIPSPGWINDASGVPGVDDPATDGVTEWAGWGFADKDWWVQTAGDQDRSQFDLGQGTVAVADPDEWDDASHPEPTSADPYDVWLSTPPIDLSVSKAGTVQLQFDSSWVPEFDDNYHQSANLTVSFDGAEPIELFRWVSDSGDSNYKESATNETIYLNVDNPANASSMVLTFGLFDAGNDWWWAIDNIVVQAEQRADRAYNPSPRNGTDELSTKTVLSWTPGEYVAGLSPQHKVILSDNLDTVADGSAVVSTQDANSFNAAGLLEYSTAYYWRVDEANQTSGWDEGSIWQFTIEPYSIPIGVANATASSRQNESSDPNFTIDGSGLGADGKHSNEVMDVMWMSANGDPSPWLMFEFDSAYKLDKMSIWNSNHSSESVIGWGIKDVEIQVSVDGLDWTLIPEPSQLTQGPGFVPSEAQVIDMGLAQAKYVRLNILNNWGGVLPQYGVAEVQFKAVPVQAREPMPADGAVNVRPDVVVAWRGGREADQSTVYVDMDANAVAAGSGASLSSNTNSVSLGSLDLQMSQTYYWRVDEVNNAEVPSVWAGPVWSLSASNWLVVDDFESYSNISPNRPFQHWLDGFGYSADDYYPDYGGNGTGAGIGHDIWSVGSLHFDGDIMETVITMPGSDQSMPFYYSNTGGVASQTEHTFAVPQDWTVGGAKTLSIAFNGQAGNTGTMFIIINNTKVIYDSGPSPLSGIGRSLWQTWSIDLATVNTTPANITKLTLGVEGSGASGRILFDDIRLYIQTVESMSADVTTPGDTLVGVPNDDDWPLAESPDLAIDDDTTTKYLHRKGGSMATGFQIEPMVGATVVTGLTLTTANDAPTRDPITFELSGSNASIDGPYTLIAAGDVVDFAGEVEWPRFTPNETPIEFQNTVAYEYYQIVFPTLRGEAETLMQIAEVELIIAQ